MLRAAKEKSVAPGVILASPYARALETATIAAKELGCSEDLIECSALRPESSPVELWAELRETAGEQVLAVGHEPLLSAAASWMLGESRLVVSFAPGTLVRIDFERLGPRPRGVLRWRL
jgi:phosphohistidine phosphatase